MRCVIVSDGKKGHVNQSFALAELLGLAHTVAHIKHLPGWYEPLSRISSYVFSPRNYPATLRLRVMEYCFDTSILKQLTGEPAAVVISAGTTAAVPALVLAHELGARSLHVLRPSLMPARCFNALVLPQHDVPRRQPANAVALPLALGPTSGSALEESRTELMRRLHGNSAALEARKQVAVLIGGDSLHHRIDSAGVLEHVRSLAAYAAAQGLGILLTTSRRTPEALEEGLKRLEEDSATVFTACVWGRADSYNPVPAYLDAASAVLVTADSISMVSECVLSGLQPLVFPVEVVSHGAKLERFFDYAYERGFAGKLNPPVFEPGHWEIALAAARKSREDVYNAIGLPRLLAELRRLLGI